MKRIGIGRLGRRALAVWSIVVAGFGIAPFAQAGLGVGDVAITEIAHVVVGGVGSTYLEVSNLGNAGVNVSGWRLCSRIDYDSTASPGSWGTRMNTAHGLMQPGDIVIIEITGTDVANLQAAVGAANFVNVAWSGFNDSVAEDHYLAADTGLYATAPFGTAANMRDFIKWNTTATVGREGPAVTNGFWPSASANISSPLSTDLTDSPSSNSIQLEMKETSPGSGVFEHESPDNYFAVNNARHSLGRLAKRGDADGSGTVDIDDASILIDECFDGPDAGSLSSGCAPVDFDDDNDVDLRDAAEFQLAFEG